MRCYRYAMHDYRQLYKMLAENYRLWIYNGQDDGCIPYVGAQEWTSHLGFPEAIGTSACVSALRLTIVLLYLWLV